ncbi:MAG: hypothetical protein F4147_03675 [Gammaproteobacteria bacterium]|nr:hypothetical protein [Gammaproteobacteria bacterium]
MNCSGCRTMLRHQLCR